MSRVLVTGASGFVGSALCRQLCDAGHEVIAVFRNAKKVEKATYEIQSKNFHPIIIEDINKETNWDRAFFQKIDTVVHLAGRVHIMHDQESDPLKAYRKLNVAATENLSIQAAKAGVKRFIYMSSIKVNGESSDILNQSKLHIFSEQEAPQPKDPYGISKYEAELAVIDVARKSGMEYVIIRPPLVYGPGVGANFLKLVKLVNSGLPLPFAAVNNKRSMIYIDNLISGIMAAINSPIAAGNTFLISDQEPISTANLIKFISKGLNKKPRIFSLPVSWLKFIFAFLNKAELSDRLLGSLVIDASSIKEKLNWQPPFSTEEGVKKTIQWYVTKHD